MKLFGWSVAFSLAVVSVGCKKSKTQQNVNYPIIDARGENADVGGAYPFPENIFSGNCETPKVSSQSLEVVVDVARFEPGEDFSGRAVQHDKRNIKTAFQVRDGVVSIPWLKGSLRVGGKFFGKRDFGEVGSLAEANNLISEALHQLDFPKNAVEQPDEVVRLCLGKNFSNSVYDASDSFFHRQHATLGIAAILTEVREQFSENLTQVRYASLMNGAKNFEGTGLDSLVETYFDYEVVVPVDGEKKRYLGRAAIADNLEFRASLFYKNEPSGGSYTYNKYFAVLPHSNEFQSVFADNGVFWNNPLVLNHEFGHLLMSETVFRKMYKVTAESNLTLHSLAAYIPKILFSQDQKQKFSIVKNVVANRKTPFESAPSVKTPFVPEPKRAPASGALEGGLNFGGATNSLTEEQIFEIVRRVDYVTRGVEEALADLVSVAKEGSYSGFQTSCIGTDRVPAIDTFGAFRASSAPKRIPTDVEIFSPLFGNMGWMIQSDRKDHRSILTDSSDCSSSPVSMSSPYTLASIFTRWIERSVIESTGKSFVDVPQNLRIEFVLDAVAALKTKWDLWVTMMGEGFSQGKFADFYSTRSVLEFARAAHATSLDGTTLAIIDAVFDSSNSNSWISRHASELKLTTEQVQKAKTKACSFAKEHRFVRQDGC